MENDYTFEVTLSVKECVERYGDGGEHAKHGAEALDMFARVLERYGMEVSTDYVPSGKRAKISIRHPSAWNAEKLRNRNGGRLRMPKPTDSPALGLDGKDLLEWLEEHTTQEGMEALGCSRRTYFRRLKELRSRYGK